MREHLNDVLYCVRQEFETVNGVQNYIFRNSRGNQLNDQNLRRSFKQFKKINHILNEYTIHDYRHSIKELSSKIAIGNMRILESL